MNPLKVRKSFVMIYYCFDVGEEIDIDRLKKIFGKTPELSRIAIERLAPKYVQHKVPPLLIRLGEKSVAGMKMGLEAKVYDFGVVTIRLWFPFTGTLEDLKKLNYKLVDNKEMDKEAETQARLLVKEIGSAITKPMESGFGDWESYIISSIKDFDRKTSPKELLDKHGTEIAQILRCEKRNISGQEIADALKNPLSYFESDLTIVDWNAAFIYDPSQSYDVPDVLEHAVIELLELRVYDKILDQHIDRTYDDIRGGKSPGIYPFSSTLKFLYEVKLEISDVIEHLENSLKLVGDLFLARVYSAAASRFYLEKWKSSVKEKLDTVESIYEMLSDRINDRRLIILEALIVLLFVIDIVLIYLDVVK